MRTNRKLSGLAAVAIVLGCALSSGSAAEQQNTAEANSQAATASSSASAALARRVAEQTQAKKLDSAWTDLKELIRLAPDDAATSRAMTELSKAIFATGDRNEIEKFSKEALDVCPGPQHRLTLIVRRDIANWAPRVERWQIAADNFNALVHIEGGSGREFEFDFLRGVVALIRVGDKDGLESFRRRTLQQFGETKNSVQAERALRVCILLPPKEGIDDFAGWSKVILAGQSDPSLTELYKNWGRLAMALLEYRRGEWVKSLEWCDFNRGNEASEKYRVTMLRLVRALNYSRLGELDNADLEFQLASATIKQNYGPNRRDDPYWFDWEFAIVLRDEAAKLMEEQKGK